MTATEFKGNAEWTKWLRETLENPVFKLALEVLNEIAPVNDPVEAAVTPHFAHFQLGAEKGYAKCLHDLVWLTKPPTRSPEPTPEPDYGTFQNDEEKE